MQELREKLEALKPVSTDLTCPAERFLKKVGEEDSELATMLSDLMMDPEVSMLSLCQELRGHGYKISRESISLYRRKVCRCDPHCSMTLGGGNE